MAVVQRPPVLLDRQATLSAAVEHLHAAADAGARLVVFPETYVPGYPVWIWRLRPEADYELTSAIHRELLANSIDLVADGLRSLREAAAKRRVVVVCGVHEREGEFSRATLYNTLVTIAADGAIVNRHRKLVPTNPERMVWGQGDASGLRVTDTTVGRLGSLICWENYMPLARAAMYEQGVDVLLAPTWDNSEVWPLSMQHIAKEGRCYVLGITSCQRGADVPADIPGRDDLYPDDDDWMSRGNSIIVDPFGHVLAGPLIGEPGILYAEIDPELTRLSRREFDVVGHYSRPDVFQLHVNRGPS